jgi:hypothetical protein
VWHPADLPEELPQALQPVPAARKRFTTVANRMNYRKMSDQALAAAAALGELDVRPDDRVLIMLPDGPGFADAFAGTIQQGAVPLPVNPLLPARHCGSRGRGRCPTGNGLGGSDPCASRSRRRVTDTGRRTTGTLGSRAATALKRGVSTPLRVERVTTTTGVSYADCLSGDLV